MLQKPRHSLTLPPQIEATPTFPPSAKKVLAFPQRATATSDNKIHDHRVGRQKQKTAAPTPTKLGSTTAHANHYLCCTSRICANICLQIDVFYPITVAIFAKGRIATETKEFAFTRSGTPQQASFERLFRDPFQAPEYRPYIHSIWQ